MAGALCVADVAARPAAPLWEYVGAPAGTDENDRLEATVRDGYIYITVARTTQVRIYSILGQLVAQQTVHAGTVRVKLPARGVYILKAGAVTRRITV